MFRVVFKNGYEIHADSIHESKRNDDRNFGETVLLIQYPTKEKMKLKDFEEKLLEDNNLEEINIYEDEVLLDTFEGYTKIQSINKNLRSGGGYYYDIQFATNLK